jgi:hypothetical protein
VWASLDEAMTAADATLEPQWIAPVRLARAEVLWLHGDSGAAQREVALAAQVSARCDPWQRGAVAVWQQRVDGRTSLVAPEVA